MLKIFYAFLDTFAEYDLLTAAISDAENINSGGK